MEPYSSYNIDKKENIKNLSKVIKYIEKNESDKNSTSVENLIRNFIKKKLPEDFYPNLDVEERLDIFKTFYESSISGHGFEKLKCLVDFNNAFDVDINNHPSKSKNGKLRIDLMQEELDEIKKAIQDKDYQGLLDGLCDLEYVLLGTVLEFGFKDVFNIAFKEVHKSNMSKCLLNPTDEEIDKEHEKTMQKYNNKFPISISIAEIGNNTVVVFKNSTTGKVVKPQSFRSPRFSKIFEFLESRL